MDPGDEVDSLLGFAEFEYTPKPPENSIQRFKWPALPHQPILEYPLVDLVDGWHRDFKFLRVIVPTFDIYEIHSFEIKENNNTF